MKTEVKTISKSPYGDYEKGETGYIDGYIRGADGRPCAVVVIESKMVMVPLHGLEVVGVQLASDHEIL